MGTDLHEPLGKTRNKEHKKRISGPVSFVKAVSIVFVLSVVGLSFYASFGSKGLKTSNEPKPPENSSSTADSIAPSGSDNKKLTDKDKNKPSVPNVVANSGARVETTTTDDGSVITKYSPKDRADNGPVVVNTDAGRTSDPRFAGQPNENLLEDSDVGRLPIIGPDGTRPFNYYARPWSGARGTRIAIVVGGLGLSQTGTQDAIKKLPEEITLAFASSGNSLARWMQEARQNGHEILLQVPFEPFDYPQTDPGPGSLLTNLKPAQNMALLHRAMAQFTNYTGIMNFMGGRFLSTPDAMDPIMRDIAQRGLMFLDDGSSSQSLTDKYAKAMEMPHAFADLQLDTEIDKEKILKKLDDLERIADRKGSAIGIASGFDESLEAIKEWSDEAGKRGIEIVGVSALADDPKHQN